MGFKIELTRQARKDLEKVEQNGFKDAAGKIILVLMQNPWQNPPPYEKLTGNLRGYYARRINIQHRLVYQVFLNEQIVKIIRMWSHYE